MVLSLFVVTGAGCQRTEIIDGYPDHYVGVGMEAIILNDVFIHCFLFVLGQGLIRCVTVFVMKLKKNLNTSHLNNNKMTE